MHTNGMSRRVTRRIVSRSMSEANPAADGDDLTGDVVGLGGAEEIDAIRRLLDGAQSAERDLLLLERFEERRLYAVPDRAAADIHRRVRRVEGLRHSRLDEPEGHAVHVDAITPPFLGQRLREPDDR